MHPCFAARFACINHTSERVSEVMSMYSKQSADFLLVLMCASGGAGCNNEQAEGL